MFLAITNLLWLLQPAATPSMDGGSAPSPTSAPAPEGCAMQMGMLAIMFVVFYFLLIRPQQKRQRETQTMLESLKRGDQVRTTGGIRGEILEITDTDVTLLVAEKVKLNILRSHIAGVENSKNIKKAA